MGSYKLGQEFGRMEADNVLEQVGMRCGARLIKGSYKKANRVLI